MKKYESILSLRLSREEKEAIDQIAKEDIRISSGTSTGAVRKMIMHWRPITEELRKVKAECLDLYQQNVEYKNAIDDYCRSTDAMKKIIASIATLGLALALSINTATAEDIQLWGYKCTKIDEQLWYTCTKIDEQLKFREWPKPWPPYMTAKVKMAKDKPGPLPVPWPLPVPKPIA